MKKRSNSLLGPALRAVRQRLGITMAEVSSRTGITASTLSRVENNGASLSYEKLVQLCEGLSVDITDFFRPQAPGAGPPRVTARRSFDRADGPVVDTPVYVQRYLHTDIAGKKLIPVITERLLQNAHDFGEFHHHPGEEFLYVLEGKMNLYTEFYAPVQVEAGQSIYFDSSMGHAFIAAGEGHCRILSVMTAPEARGPSPRIATPADFEVASELPLRQKPHTHPKPKRAR